ncbi:hypothetical protein L195_g046386, partial [Trifolium pratense]
QPNSSSGSKEEGPKKDGNQAAPGGTLRIQKWWGLNVVSVKSQGSTVGEKAQKGEAHMGESKKKVKLTADDQFVVHLIDVLCVMAEKDEVGRKRLFGDGLQA